MKSMTVGDFKTYFSEVLETVKSGEGVEVTFGKKKKVVGYFVPELHKDIPKRVLGILEGKAKVTFKDNFAITEEEFLGE